MKLKLFFLIFRDVTLYKAENNYHIQVISYTNNYYIQTKFTRTYLII